MCHLHIFSSVSCWESKESNPKGNSWSSTGGSQLRAKPVRTRRRNVWDSQKNFLKKPPAHGQVPYHGHLWTNFSLLQLSDSSFSSAKCAPIFSILLAWQSLSQLRMGEEQVRRSSIDDFLSLDTSGNFWAGRFEILSPLKQHLNAECPALVFFAK